MTMIFQRAFYNIKAYTVGKFTLTISKQDAGPVNVDELFGSVPFRYVGENNQLDLSPLNRMIIGISLKI
jgi:hypothetical protein